MARETSQALEKLRARPHAYSSCRWSQWAGWICECGLSKEIFAASLEAAVAKPEPVQLVDLSFDIKPQISSKIDTIKIKPEVDGSFAKDDEVAKFKTKSAAQIFMEEKRAAGLAKEKIRAKLTLLEEELKLGQQLLLQAQTLRKSKEALLTQKVRVTYNKCHKFWRGSVISRLVLAEP